MSSEWPVKTIDELKADFRSAIAMGPFGSRIKAENFVTEGVPVLKGGNLHGAFIDDSKCDYLTEEKAEELKSSIAVTGDIVITHRGTIGQVSIIPENSRYPRYVVSQSQLKVSLNKGLVNPLFVNYYLRSREGQHQLLSYSSQVGVPAIAKASTSVRQIKVPCPPIQVQHQIVSVLKVLDDKIELNRQTNQTLEKTAQAIFKSWFVDFEPTKAKIAVFDAGGTEEDALLAAMTAISGKNNAELEQFKNVSSEQYEKLKSTAELFPSDMQDSELGEIPDGWEVQKTGEAVTAVGGGTPSTKNPDFWDGGNINWTTPRDLSSLQDKVLTETSRKITEQGLTKISSRLLPVDTVLMSSRAPVGYLALAKIPVAINQGYIAMKCDKVLTPEYVLQWCSASMEEIKGRAGGTTFAEVSRTNFREIPVIVPSQGVITSYSDKVKSIYDLITKNILQTKTLTEIRDTLLPRLLSGEIDVSHFKEAL